MAADVLQWSLTDRRAEPRKEGLWVKQIQL